MAGRYQRPSGRAPVARRQVHGPLPGRQARLETNVYIVEVRNRQEIREVKELFSSLAPEFEVYQLAEGTITAYAVHVLERHRCIIQFTLF